MEFLSPKDLLLSKIVIMLKHFGRNRQTDFYFNLTTHKVCDG